MDESVLAERAERYLLSLLRDHASWAMHEPPPDLAPETIEEQQRDRFDDALQAYTTLGVLTEDAAERWRTRWGTDEPGAFGPATAAAPDGLRARAQQLLEARFEAIPPAAGEATEAEAALMTEPMRAFMTAMNAVTLCGLVPPDQAQAWHDRLERRLGVPERMLRAREATFAELLRVVPGPLERRAGVRITTAELYRDGVAVRWQSVAPGPEPIPHDADDEEHERAFWAQHVDVELGDDIGTEYTPASAGSSGAGGAPGVLVTLGHAQFSPAVPERASRLEVRAREDTFVVELGG